MNAQIETDTSRFSGELPNLGIINVVNDLEVLEEIFQIRLRLVGLTRRINAQDTTRLSALINIQHAMAQLEDARNIFRSAN